MAWACTLSIWDEAQDAYSVQCFMKGVLESVGEGRCSRCSGGEAVEVFPKQSSVGPDGWGAKRFFP